MSCRQNYVDQILADIRDIVGINRTSAQQMSSNKMLLSINKDNPSLLTKENTVEWGRALAKKINDKYHSKLYGTVIYVNTRKYDHATELTWEIPMKLIDEYERLNESSQAPVVKKTAKYQDEINKLTDRVNNLKRSLASNKGDRPKVAELTPTGVELHDSIDLTHYSSYRLL